ncbi:hypothetical protein HPB49_021281 [Dermacentor silvarum]|uniref:Uncharacterized protein n=1 Tax=Dermacentor silvarum TaxID=543639 RepID=A0ACB8CBG5_DERSI|nr:hypothetical protein HPB49_021281 [Dermacentor silvarum]
MPKTKSIPSQPTATFCSGTERADASTHHLTETYNAAKQPHYGSCKYKPYGPPYGQSTFARRYTPWIYANTARRRAPPRDTFSGTVRHRRVTKKQCQLPSAARSSAESQATKETWSSTCLASWNASGRKRRPHGFDASRLLLRGRSSTLVPAYSVCVEG